MSVVSQDVGEVTVFPPLLRFSNTNWNTQQTVIVTGIDDKTIDGIQSTPIVISVVDPVSDASYESVANQTVTASTTDNDYDDSDDYLDFVIEMIDVKIDDMVDVMVDVMIDEMVDDMVDVIEGEYEMDILEEVRDENAAQASDQAIELAQGDGFESLGSEATFDMAFEMVENVMLCHYECIKTQK